MVSNQQTSRLVIIEGEDKGRIIPLSNGSIVIGRSKGDVLVHDPRVSRSHVVLHYDEFTHKLTFTDLKSLNGTFVNGQKAEAGQLNDGDKLQVGNTLLDCQLVLDKHEATMVSDVSDVIQPRRREEPQKMEDSIESIIVRPGESGKTAAPKDEKSISAIFEPSITLEPTKEQKEQADRQAKQPERRIKVKKQSRTPIYVALGVVAILGLFFLLPTSGDVKVLNETLAKMDALEKEGRALEAIAMGEKLTTDFPESNKLYLSLGNLYTSAGKAMQAIGSYRKAHALPPENGIVHIKLIRVLLREGLSKEAAEELRHIEATIKEGKHSKELFVEAAHLFLEFKELKQPPEKTIILARALQKEYAPGSSIGYKLEAQAHLQENHPEQAVPVLEKARVFDPKDEWVLESLVLARLTLKDVEGTQKTLDQWLELTPESTKALLIYAYLRSSEGNYKVAVGFLQRILDIAVKRPKDPFYPEALNLTGQIYTQLGQNQEAVTFFNRSCELGFEKACQNPARTTTGIPKKQ